jgi:hypothetical protein
VSSVKQQIPESLRRLGRSALARSGYQLSRVKDRDEKYESAAFSSSLPLPEGAEESLRADNPRLLELRERYAKVQLPMAVQTLWDQSYLERELDLRGFRGDNAFVWQFRNVRSDARLKYYLYLRDLATRDTNELLHRLDEDGQFGCWTFDYPGWPRVSRDLLDSINELYFLDHQFQLLSRADWTVLDIGAGYGRLAHRAATAVPGLVWLCTDAIPESTFLCEYYLQYRQAQNTEVIPLDELSARLAQRKIDLAVNVHSFSEMSEAAVAGWLDLLVEHEVPRLFIVPNHSDQLLTEEKDGSRGSFDHLLTERGYKRTVCEPVFPDPAMPELMGVSDQFLVFQR